MKSPKQLPALLAVLFSLAAPLFAVVPGYKIDPPQFPDANTVRLTLLSAPIKAVYIIQSTTNIARPTWNTLVTGAVGQVVFDLPRPANAAVFYRADDPPVGVLMASNEVATVIAQALTRAHQLSTTGTVAVVDREGFVLGVWGFPAGGSPALDVIDAITKAGTAAFLSSDDDAFTSRTAGFIVQQHFPPGIVNKENGPLVGVNFSNLSFSDVNHFKDPSGYNPAAFGGGGTNGTPITPLALSALSGLAGSPGGVPLYRGINLIGGVGVVLAGGKPPLPELMDIQQTSSQYYDADEDAALAGQVGFTPRSTILATEVFIAGIRLPYVNSSTTLGAVAPLGTIGAPVAPYTNIVDSPAVIYPTLTLGTVAGELRAPIIADPIATPIDGQPRLTAAEVTNILTAAAQRAAITRGGIRLPAGTAAQVFITVVNNPGDTNTAPMILGTFRTPSATVFSWDVAVQKARTAIMFSDTNRAFSSRTVGFMAQSFYPPGIAGTSPGPFYGLQETFSLLPAATRLLVSASNPSGSVTNPLNGVTFNTNALPNTVAPNLPNGITIFPGGFPLYRNGKLIGAIGVSGDGIDQDDIISASGTTNYLAPDAIRADNFSYRGARLPYAKFPRDPDL